MYNIKAIPVTSFVAQLIPLPPDAPQIERNALHKITHMATNALPLADFFNLNSAGGPALRSLSATSAAALYRTSAKTLTHWPEWKRQLMEAGTEFLPFASWGNGIFSNDFWDSTPIAFNLDHAFKGFSGDPLWSHGARKAIQELGLTFPGGAEDPLSKQLQSTMYKSLVLHAFPCNLAQTIYTRIAKLFLPYEVTYTSLEISHALDSLRSVRKHDAMRALKTWVNSWATSHRFHEAIRYPCLFGCEGAKDCLTHYVMCPILFALQVQFLPDTPPCPLKRIGLIAPSRESMLRVACCFAGFHAVKRACPSLKVFSATLNLDQRFATHKIFAEAFWTEAMDNGLRCLHYRPQFGTSAALSWHNETTPTDIGVSACPTVQ